MLTGGIDGYIVHLLRKGPYEAKFTDRFSFVVEAITLALGQQEDAGAWINVSGRGTLSLLEDRIVWPPGFDGANASSITNQLGQPYVSKSGGFIMDAELDRSAGRFSIPITHTVQTSTIGQTVTLRFDNLRLLHDRLCKTGPMDAQMVGLDYQCVDVRGTDKSATVTVAMAAQDSLIGVTFERDASKVANWVVGQGTGEGINSKIAVQQDAAAITALRRREGFIDDRSVSDQTQLGLDVAGSLALLKRADQRIVTRFIDSTHTQLYRDFDLGDTIGLTVAPVNFSQKFRVIGVTVTDQDSEIEDCALDLNSMRTEHLLKLLNGTLLPTVNSLSVLNRMPQGAQWNDSQNYPDNCTPTFPFHFDVFIPSNILRLNYGKLSFKLRAFRRDVAALNTVTSGGGSSHTHGVPSESVTAAVSTSQTHQHVTTWNVGARVSTWGATAGGAPVTSAGAPEVATTNLDGGHTHSVTGQTTGGTTSAAENAHTHQVVPALTDGIFEGAVATGVTVVINGTDRTSALGGGAGFTSDQTELEISQWLTIGAWNAVDLTPSGLGRITGHLRVTGYSQSV